MSQSRYNGWLMLSVAVFVLQPHTVAAQSAGAGPEEITVTARKREEDLQSVPIAVSAFTDEDLAIRDIFSLERLADQTPGLTFATTGAITGTRAVIRGVAQQTRVGDETNVATFIDGVYTPGFSGAEFFGFDSLERVEVIKGPQSALYGRNSFAGAINYVSKKPTYEFEYGGRLEVGQGERQGLTAYAAGPLIDDRLALRVDGGYNRTGGTNINRANNEPLGSTDTQFARATLVADPLDNLRLVLRLSAQDDLANPLAQTLVADDDPNRVGLRLFVSPFEIGAGNGQRIGRLYSGRLDNRSNNYTVDPRAYSGDREIRRASFEFDWDLGWASLIGITGYQDRQVATLNDYNTCRNDVRPAVCDTVSPTAVGTFFNGTAGGNSLLLGGPQIVSVLTGTVEDRDEFSQNLYLQSNGDGDFQWLAGLYFSTEDFKDQNQRLSDATLQSPDGSTVYAIGSPTPLTDSTTLISNDFYSVFASGSLDFADIWNVTLEGRYTREDKEADQIADRFPIRVPPDQPTGLQQRAFNFFTPRVIVTVTPTDDFLAYVSAAKGVKSGGFNPGSVQFPTFDQEENWTYEIGSKWTLWDGRARLNGAAYFIDWDDQQITATDPDLTRLPITVNVASTEIMGVELEAFLSPTDWLEFNLGATVLDAEYKDGATTTIEQLIDCDAIPIPCDVTTPLGAVTSGSIAGKQVAGTPEATLNFGAQARWPMPGGNMDFIARADYAWQDKIYVDEANAGFIPSRETLNLRVGLDGDTWSFQGFCNNATNDKTPLFALPPRDILGVPHYSVVNRNLRLCGVQMSLRM